MKIYRVFLFHFMWIRLEMSWSCVALISKSAVELNETIGWNCHIWIKDLSQRFLQCLANDILKFYWFRRMRYSFYSNFRCWKHIKWNSNALNNKDKIVNLNKFDFHFYLEPNDFWIIWMRCNSFVSTIFRAWTSDWTIQCWSLNPSQHSCTNKILS